MSERFVCGDNPTLLAYLYDECEPGERAAIDAHVAICPACTAEIAALSSTRSHLAAWAPPEAELGFQIVAPQTSGLAARNVFAGPGLLNAERVAPASWWKRPIPAWAQLAAAVVIFATGLSLGIARGTMSDAQTAAQGQPAATPGVSSDDLAQLEQRLRAEFTQVRETSSPAAASQPSGDDARLIQQVRVMQSETEQRLRREIAIRMTQLAGDFEIQRSADLTAWQRAFGQMESTSNAEFRRLDTDVNSLYRTVSQQGR